MGKLQKDAINEIADSISKVIVARVLGMRLANEMFSPEYEYAAKRLEKRMASGGVTRR